MNHTVLCPILILWPNNPRTLIERKLINAENAQCRLEKAFGGRKLMKVDNTSHLKKVDKVSGQGAGRRESAAYTVVCEHFEPTHNAAKGT